MIAVTRRCINIYNIFGLVTFGQQWDRDRGWSSSSSSSCILIIIILHTDRIPAVYIIYNGFAINLYTRDILTAEKCTRPNENGPAIRIIIIIIITIRLIRIKRNSYIIYLFINILLQQYNTIKITIHYYTFVVCS